MSDKQLKQAKKLLKEAQKQLDVIEDAKDILNELYDRLGDGCIKRTNEYLREEFKRIEFDRDNLQKVVEVAEKAVKILNRDH